MANMESSQRSQMERLDLGDARSSRLLRSRSATGPATYTLVGVPLLAVLTYSAVAGIESWWQWLVLGVIATTTVGLMIAISPNRRA